MVVLRPLSNIAVLETGRLTLSHFDDKTANWLPAAELLKSYYCFSGRVPDRVIKDNYGDPNAAVIETDLSQHLILSLHHLPANPLSSMRFSPYTRTAASRLLILASPNIT